MSNDPLLKRLFREVGTERVIEVDELCVEDEACAICNDITWPNGDLVKASHSRHHIRLDALKDERF
jgi:hypothetical protein